jgi:hypothetical protein
MIVNLASTSRSVRACQWYGGVVDAGSVLEAVMEFGGEGGTLRRDSRTGEVIGVLVRTTHGEQMMRPMDFLVELTPGLVMVMSPVELFCLFTPDTSWSPLGTHIDRRHIRLEFSQALGEDGLPLWERPEVPRYLT